MHWPVFIEDDKRYPLMRSHLRDVTVSYDEFLYHLNVWKRSLGFTVMIVNAQMWGTFKWGN